MLVAAESLGLLKRRRLAELVDERRGRPGIGKLAGLLQLEPAIARSGLEVDVLPLWRIAGVARPLVNYPVRVPGKAKPLTVDFAWPEIRMVVEADSQRFHGDWERAEADREWDQLLALAGWACHRFVRRRIVADPSGSADRLRELTRIRIAELGA
jgi:very-short-patch-repair endonuclease